MEGTSGAPDGYGAAAASLKDPACTPGTAEFKAAKKENDRLLAAYRKYKEFFIQDAGGVSWCEARQVPQFPPRLLRRALGSAGQDPGVLRMLLSCVDTRAPC